jgi:hypothetical protein
MTTTPTTGALADTMRLANVFTDVAVTIGALGVNPARIEVCVFDLHGSAFAVYVQLHGADTTTVDMLAATLPGRWDHTDDRVASGLNYGRRGLCRFGGETVTLTVYTGRPAPVTADLILGSTP